MAATRSDWLQALSMFEEHLEASGRSAATCDGYLKHLGWLADGSPSGPWQLSTSELSSWLDSRRWSRETRRKVPVSFRLFYAWAVSQGLCQWAPTAGLPSPAPNKRGPAERPLPPAWQPAVEGFFAWLRAGGRSEGTLQVRYWHLSRLADVAADPCCHR